MHRAIKKHMANIQDPALAVAGGVAGNFITTQLEKQKFMQGFSQYTPVATVLLGTLGYLFAKNPMIKAFSLGMVAVGGTETVEGLIYPSNVNQVTQGAAPTARQFGYVQQYTPSDISAGQIRTNDGIVVR